MGGATSPRLTHVLAAALALAACAPSSPSATSLLRTPAEPELQAVVIASQLLIGPQRVPIGILYRNTPVSDASVRVRAYRQVPSDPLATAADAPFKGAGLQGQGAYVAHLAFGAPGPWIAEIAVRRPGAAPAVIRLPLTVGTKSSVPAVGEPAPASRNPTVKDVADVSEIDSGRPPNDMHQISIADAIAQHHPALVVFATPAFCTSQMCGPQVKAVERLQPEYRDRLAFIHVEIYRNFRPDPSKMEFTPTVHEWRLQTEPWVFLIDRGGIIRAAFEGPTATDELRAAVDRLLSAP